MHSLEDMILERVLEGSEFASAAQPVDAEVPKIVPHKAVSIAQSLKPYARSLSHELRTPMQGVVGMLDVMMANVKEASESFQLDPRTREILHTLKENIEAVQGQWQICATRLYLSKLARHCFFFKKKVNFETMLTVH